MNTKNYTSVRVVIFRKDGKFTAVCIDFDIIEEHDTYEEAQKSIMNAAKCYFNAVVEHNLPNHHLNKRADAKYLKLFIEGAQAYSEPKKTFAQKKHIGIFAIPLVVN